MYSQASRDKTAFEGFKRDVLGSAKIIPSNYRGELKAIAINLDPQNNIEIHIGDRIAKLVIMKVEAIHFNEVGDLEHSDRGEGGFGSSGVSHSI